VIGNEWLEIGNRISCVVCCKSYVGLNLRPCIPVFIFSVVGNRISCVANFNDPPLLSIDHFSFCRSFRDVLNALLKKFFEVCS